ncbi:MAG: hypothetical protein P8P30_05590 [Rickettsiales bacterium]|nr:hypothetical protein [Rickettsiales bacterium]
MKILKFVFIFTVFLFSTSCGKTEKPNIPDDLPNVSDVATLTNDKGSVKKFIFFSPTKAEANDGSVLYIDRSAFTRKQMSCAKGMMLFESSFDATGLSYMAIKGGANCATQLRGWLEIKGRPKLSQISSVRSSQKDISQFGELIWQPIAKGLSLEKDGFTMKWDGEEYIVKKALSRGGIDHHNQGGYNVTYEIIGYIYDKEGKIIKNLQVYLHYASATEGGISCQIGTEDSVLTIGTHKGFIFNRVAGKIRNLRFYQNGELLL